MKKRMADIPVLIGFVVHVTHKVPWLVSGEFCQQSRLPKIIGTYAGADCLGQNVTEILNSCNYTGNSEQDLKALF